MSAIGDYVGYIHYEYNHVTGRKTPQDNANYLIGIYSNSKVQQRYRESITFLNNKVKEKYLSQINAAATNKVGEKEFFALLDDIQKDSMSKAAEKMVDQLGTTGVGMADVAVALNKMEDQPQLLQNIINSFKKIMQQITNSSFSRNPIPVLTYDMLKGDVSIDNIKKTFRDAYLSDGMTFKVDKSYSRAIGSHMNDINKVLASLSAIESIQGGSMKDFSSEVQSNAIKAFVWSVFNRINIIVGFVSEDKLAEILPDELQKRIASFFVGEKVSVKVSQEGTQSTKQLNVKTEDVSINLNFDKILEGQASGQIDVRLPRSIIKKN